MKSLLLSLMATIFGIATALAYSDYLYVEEPLLQTTFDRLIPTSHPTIQPNLGEVVPTTRPLIYPGIPEVHIINNLIHSTDQQLLIVNHN